MSAADNIAVFLQTYGGWGLSAIFMLVIWYLYKQIIKLNLEINNRDKEVNAKLLDMLQERVRIDTEYKEAFKTLKEIIRERKVLGT